MFFVVVDLDRVVNFLEHFLFFSFFLFFFASFFISSSRRVRFCLKTCFSELYVFGSYVCVGLNSVNSWCHLDKMYSFKTDKILGCFLLISR